MAGFGTSSLPNYCRNIFEYTLALGSAVLHEHVSYVACLKHIFYHKNKGGKVASNTKSHKNLNLVNGFQKYKTMTALWTEYWNISRHSGKYKNIFCAQTSDGRWIVAESKQKTSFIKFIISLLGQWHTFKDEIEWSAIGMSIIDNQSHQWAGISLF